MIIPGRKLELKLWREDLGDFYMDLLRTVVGDMARFEDNLDRYRKSDSIYPLRKFRTAILVGMALSRETIYDKRYILDNLLGGVSRGYFDHSTMDDLFNGIFNSEEGYNHVQRANYYLERNAAWKNPVVHSFEGTKKIKVAMMRAAARSHYVHEYTNFSPYYGKGIEVIW